MDMAHVDTLFVESLRILRSLVAKQVETGGKDDGTREALERAGKERGDTRIIARDLGGNVSIHAFGHVPHAEAESGSEGDL